MKPRSVHFCRCHACGHVTTKVGSRVTACGQCKKPLAQYYYFDDRNTSVWSEHLLRPKKADFEYAPIYGLTAYWDNF